MYPFDWIDGDDSLLVELGSGETLIEEQFAKAHDVGVGDRYEVVTPSGGRHPDRRSGSTATRRSSRARSPTRRRCGRSRARPDRDAWSRSTTRPTRRRSSRRSRRRSRPFPNVKVESKAEYKETLDDQLDQIVYLLYALLAMSLVISLFGIANSLFLSIHERTGELGVLRAIGATGPRCGG